MAIAEMSRIRLYGLSSERALIMAELMHFGAIQIEDAHSGIDEEPHSSSSKLPGIVRLDTRAEVQGSDSLLVSLAAALDALAKNAPQKKMLFQSRRTMSREILHGTLTACESTMKDVNAILALEAKIDSLKSEESRIRGKLDFIAPWRGIGIDLSVEATKHTRLQAGVMPVNQSLDELKDALSVASPSAILIRQALTREASYCYVIWHHADEAEVQKVLKENGWNRISFRDLPGDPDVTAMSLNERMVEIAGEKSAFASAIKDLAGARTGIENLYDAIQMEREHHKANTQLVHTEKTFSLHGWIPADQYDPLERKLTGSFICQLEQDAVRPEDEVPVFVRSNAITEAIQPVMNMYGTPSPKEIDPNFLTLPFFAIFFGIIISDAGYGLILVLGAAFVLLRFKLEDPVRRFAKLILISGFATIFWGIMFGGFFGIAQVSQHALWFNPGGEQGTEILMIWCLVLGVIHLFTGIGLKAANLIRRKAYGDALFDAFFPLVMFTGFGMTVLPNVPGLDPAMTAQVSAIGLPVLAVGAALTVLTAGRKNKSIVGKIFGGLPKLYDIIGFLGDVLSYMRLLALCLAGIILAGLVNGLAGDLEGLVVRVIGGTVLLLFGHGINFAMGVLGAFVHSCRLQYLEFFSKFLEGGGKPFRPFGPHTKYIVVKQED